MDKPSYQWQEKFSFKFEITSNDPLFQFQIRFSLRNFPFKIFLDFLPIHKNLPDSDVKGSDMNSKNAVLSLSFFY